MKLTVLLVLVWCFGYGSCRYSQNPVRRINMTLKQDNSFEYYSNHNSPHKISIPIMIHLDKALTRDLTKEYKKTVKKYFQDVLKSVESLFRHPSLNQTVHFNLLGVKMLRNATKKFQMNENVSEYLKSYCYWQGERKLIKKKWYYSVLFTGLDVYYLDVKNNQVRSSAGRGYMRGICSIRNSCTLLEWRTQNNAYVMAHELAHSLGISHDGPPHNHCRGHRYIMDAKYNPRKTATAWSPCNKQALDRFLKSRLSWCLRPSNNNYQN